MGNKALVVIDIQNDITKNYKEIIENINQALDWAIGRDIHVVYIKHNNLSAITRTFKPDTSGAELVSDMKIISKNIFTKTKGNALTSKDFYNFYSSPTQHRSAIYFPLLGQYITHISFLHCYFRIIK